MAIVAPGIITRRNICKKCGAHVLETFGTQKDDNGERHKCKVKVKKYTKKQMREMYPDSVTRQQQQRVASNTKSD